MSLTTQYISIKEILSRLFSNPLMEGLNEADVASYIADCISLIGAPMASEDKVITYTIENYRAFLPFDMLYIQQTRRKNSNASTGQIQLFPMRYASDTFSSKYIEVGSPDFAEASGNYDWTYSLNNGWIYTNFSSGYVEQSYKALKTDEDGLPMIPDDAKFSLAVEWYIKYKWYTTLWELGKVSDKVLENAKQEYSWYVGGAGTRARLMSIDQAETFRGAFTKILGNSTAARNYFQDFGRQEFIKTGRI
jgi:hypothetical protein